MEKNEFQGRILKEKCINPTTFFYLCETRKNKEEERKDIQQNATYEKWHLLSIHYGFPILIHHILNKKKLKEV